MVLFPEEFKLVLELAAVDDGGVVATLLLLERFVAAGLFRCFAWMLLLV